MSKVKINVILFTMLIAGLVIIGFGTINLVRAKNGIFANKEQRQAYLDTSMVYLEGYHKATGETPNAETFADAQEAQKQTRTIILERNAFRATSTLIVGALIIALAILTKVFFVK